MLTRFTTLMVAFEVLTESLPIDIWWLTTARGNSYQPVLVCINCAIVEAWLPFMTWRTCILKTFTCQAEVFCSCKLWSHCSHCKHDLHDNHGTLWWIPRPLLPWDDDDSHWSRHHNRMTYYYQWKQKGAPKLVVEGNRFWSRSIITTILLPFLAWWLRNPIPVPRVISWPIQLLRQIQPQISMHILLCSKVFLKTRLKHFCYL